MSRKIDYQIVVLICITGFIIPISGMIVDISKFGLGLSFDGDGFYRVLGSGPISIEDDDYNYNWFYTVHDSVYISWDYSGYVYFYQINDYLEWLIHESSFQGVKLSGNSIEITYISMIGGEIVGNNWGIYFIGGIGNYSIVFHNYY